MQSFIKIFMAVLTAIVAQGDRTAKLVIDGLTAVKTKIETLATAIGATNFIATTANELATALQGALATANARIDVLASAHYGDIETALAYPLGEETAKLREVFASALGGTKPQANKKYVLFLTAGDAQEQTLNFTDTRTGETVEVSAQAGEKLLVVTNENGEAVSATLLSDSNAERLAALESGAASTADLTDLQANLDKQLADLSAKLDTLADLNTKI